MRLKWLQHPLVFEDPSIGWGAWQVDDVWSGWLDTIAFISSQVVPSFYRELQSCLAGKRASKLDHPWLPIGDNIVARIRCRLQRLLSWHSAVPIKIKQTRITHTQTVTDTVASWMLQLRRAVASPVAYRASLCTLASSGAWLF